MSAAGPIVPRLWNLLCGTTSPVSRATYLTVGVTLMLFKYLVEAAVIGATTGRLYSPLAFVSPLLTQRQDVLQGAPAWVAWGMILWSIPFVWIAVSMSIHRAHSADLSPWAGLLVLVPLVNLPAMLLLAALPDWDRSSSADPAVAVAPPRRRDSSPSRDWTSTWVAISAGVLFLGLMLFVSVYLLANYGSVLFFVSPVAAGAVTGFLANRPHSRSFGGTLGVVLAMLCCAALGLLLFALEGAICILMAVPIVFPLGLVGGLIGYLIAVLDPTGMRRGLPCLAIVPLGAWVEQAAGPPLTHAVVTTIDIDAPADKVWNHVVSFPALAPPEEWYFRAGISCPTGARIDGTGVGAIRRCEFTTGEFVEPITLWDPPRQLAFDVVEQPEPMFELSPYHHLHPPHMHGTFAATKGEFRLVAIDDRRTQLIGTTWYRVDMGPQTYWKLWTDAIIHRIHRRVLLHVRDLAEAGDRDH